MIDYHSHVLAGVDDGPKEIGESVRMLEALRESGFSDVVLTPHFYSNHRSVESFAERRADALKRLLESTEGRDVPRLHVGAEVYLTELLFNNADLNPVTVGGRGSLMLTELPFDPKLSPYCENLLQRLISERGIKPVLAHIERYPFLMEEKTLVRLLKMGCVAQVNYSAFVSPHRNRRLEHFVKNGYITVFGTDAHSDASLTEWVNRAIEEMRRIFGAEFVERIGR